MRAALVLFSSSWMLCGEFLLPASQVAHGIAVSLSMMIGMILLSYLFSETSWEGLAKWMCVIIIIMPLPSLMCGGMILGWFFGSWRGKKPDLSKSG